MYDFALKIETNEPEPICPWPMQNKIPIIQTPVNDPSPLKHVLWTRIHSFHNIFRARRNIGTKHPTKLEEVVYRGKIKLHGQNAGITIGQPLDNKSQPNVVTQTRRYIVPSENAAGEVVFPSNVEYFGKLWYNLRNMFQSDEMKDMTQFTIFGEWCGKGIQKHVAVSELDEKIFAVFAIHFGDFLMVDPEEITKFMTMDNTIEIPSRIHVLPWQTDKFVIDFKNEEKIQPVLDEIDNLVVKFCQCDPWVKETMGIEGMGEGLVLYPISKLEPIENKEFTLLTCKDFGTLGFKAKGDQFRVVENKKSASTKVPKPGCLEIVSFVKMVCTEARLQQGVTEECATERRHIGALMKWIYTDVESECKLELEENGFTFKMIRKELGRHVKTWFFEKCDAK